LTKAHLASTIKVFGEIRGDAPELMAGMSGRANIPPPKWACLRHTLRIQRVRR
jgi:hypothetical protein